MSQNNHRLFTIGQFAALHQINKKTLMWYDQIGLFTPAVVKENGYRYYTYQQCFVLETILMLRELNVSIPEIQQFMAHRTTDSFHTILQEKTRQIQETIAHLTQVQEALQHQTEQLSSLKNLDLYGYSLVEKPAQRLLLRKTPPKASPEQEAELLFSEVGRHSAYRMYGILYGAILPAESLYHGDFTDYRGIFLQIPQAEIETNVHIQPSGLYLRTHFKGSWEGLPGKYREIMAYAREHGLEFTGYSYETGINDVISNAPEDCITRIEIPVKQSPKV